MELNKKYLLIIIGIIILIGYFIVIDDASPSFSAMISNSVEVEKNTELTYYLNVSFDGVDINGNSSSDTSISDLNSEVIYVEDKIPVGLTFQGFVTTSNGTIGAFKKSDGTSCVGKVIDDTPNSNGSWNNDNTEYTYHGLHYKSNSRTVSFKVKNLQAGCVLTVGIITKTPENVESRLDFYNYGTAYGQEATINSNLTHVFMGSETQKLYKVRYEYIGSIPENAPDLPYTSTYAKGVNVGVANNPIITGFKFNGWTTSDVIITDGTFEMPEKEVVLKGSFTELPKYKVRYSVAQGKEGSSLPEDYSLPQVREYYEGEIVKLDPLKKGTMLNNFQFHGWKSNDVIIDDEEFVMPAKDISIFGEFNVPEYKVVYKFYESNLPDELEEVYLEEKYLKSSTVKLIDVPQIEGYKFLGWNHQDNFLINEDTIIYGGWKKILGTFEPKISQVLLTEDKSYEVGEKIKFKIVITNDSDFEIKDILIKKNLPDAIFISENEIVDETISYVKIPTIAANESIDLELEYIVKENDVGNIKSEVEVVGAIADNGFELADENYSTSSSANLAKELVNTPITNKVIFPIVSVFLAMIIIGIGLIIYGKKKK